MKKKHKVYLLIGIFLIASIIYVCNRFFLPSYYQQTIVKFNPKSGAPIIDVEIEGILYPLELDIGSKFPVTLHKKILTTLHKKPHGVVRWKDFRGTSFESPAYIIKKLNIGDLKLTDVIVREKKQDCITTKITDENSEKVENQKLGALGKPILKKFNLLLDFANSRIIASNDLKKLKKAGFNIDKMTKVSVEQERGIIMNINTDLGIKKFGLDTGASLNFIRTSLVQDKQCTTDEYALDTFTTSKFEIGGKNFGEVSLHLLDIDPQFQELDGILGMSFLENHVVYIDYPHKTVYIGEPQPLKD